MTTKNCDELWDRCLRVIKDNIKPEEFEKWFKPTVPVSYENNEISIQIPTRFYFDTLEEKYAELIRETLNREVGVGTKLVYVISIDNTQQTTSRIEGKVTTCATPTPTTILKTISSPIQSKPVEGIDSYLNRNLSFEDFVEGKENKNARIAGVSIGNNPGKTIFNPLFLYGKPGVGKTHLANAIGLMTKELHPELKVLYVSANVFSQQYGQATIDNKTNDFLTFYFNIDLLIIDDIHVLASKKKTQDVFFQIFNYLHQSGRQLILTSDRSPELLEGFEDRLLSRFRGGLSTRIEEPGIDLRKAILRKKIAKDDIHIPEDVIDFIAQNIMDTRALEGAISKLLLYSIVNNNQDINLELAEEVVGTTTDYVQKAVTIDDIKNAVCEHYKLPVEDVLSKERKHELVLARQLAMYLAKQHTQQSLSNIGLHIGHRDHATVLHACKVISDQLDWDKNLRNTIKELEMKLTK